MSYKRGTHPHSLANLKPPFRKGEVHNPQGWNAFGLHRFLDGRLAKAIAHTIRAEGLESRVTPGMVALIFLRTVFPHQSEKQRLRAMRRVLPIFRAAMRTVEREPGDVPSARELRLM